MIGLYLFGILMGIGTAFVFRKTLFKGEPVPFVMELPNYRMPGGKKMSDTCCGIKPKIFYIVPLQ